VKLSLLGCQPIADAFESKIRSMIEQHTKLLDMRKEEEDISSRLRFMTRREGRGPKSDQG